MERDEAEQLVKNITDHHLVLEIRVEKLEKELQLISNVIAIAALVGGYLVMRWYAEQRLVIDMPANIPQAGA